MLRGVVCESTSSEECGKNTTLHSREDLSKSQISFEESSSSGAAGGDGCLYPDNVIMDDGVSFQVRYTGCLEVKTSMKSLDFQTRTQVARESINRVCEAAGLKCAGKRRIDKRILQYISDRPCLQNAGTNVIINVSSKALNLVNTETGDIIVNHNMPRISFASGGDSDTLDFLAYIAKNEDDWRACYVLECGGGQSEDLIVTIGKAFMLRYNALNKNTSPYPNKNYNIGNANDKDYYNDLPNKLPPDLLCENNLPHKVTQLHIKKPRNRLSSNLIDLNSPPPDQIAKMNLSSFETLKEEQSSPAVRDVFDIQPFSLSAEVQRSQLMTESWFHGGISRPTSESLLCYDGDFLVRESQGKHGQYVLTGLEGKTPKHLLLIDPEGIVRTKDRIFDSISHLINYHWYNTLPIISEETELVLKNPVLKKFIVKED
ncbi:SHC-transforming protein 4 isoform X1 [Episyrphus balteatus]|uniref:SHC-transforming protein 4 isoform X1 n=1 Tax=Episyrphus balteatus TaxID=286459 RepID=UPI002485FBDF|nr:SHC-transforming protein 4 isoform X1 [Episyrphus balteatus]XP_055839797.1 SHC-transforming protein 4 isoform X1 [Episyrphus balteatus]XP_055839798.1 SHC-transforming protein 4 isoform X1 [Episyrphus balteatus]